MISDPASARTAAAPKPAQDPADGSDIPCEFAPILLEDLLCGLPPAQEDDEFAGLSADDGESALLLAEMGQHSPVQPGGWAAETEVAEAEPAPPVSEEPIPASVVEELRAADPGGAMDAVTVFAAPADEDDDVLELTEELEAPPEPPPAPEPPPPQVGEDPLAERVEAILAASSADGTAPDKGDRSLPENRDALALLLSEPPPTNDFAALDALFACWPRSTHHSESRALLAVANNVSRCFGLPGKLPMATSKAWRMLSPVLFEAEFAGRLAQVGQFIAEWQKTQRTFLILEFNEVELIEYLFESLPPAGHADLLAGVMNFKVLSNRRMGLLRRVPTRLKKQIQPLLPDRKEEALILLAHAKALLERIADPSGFAPIVATATRMAEDMEKIMKSVAAQGAPAMPPPGGGGMALGRLG